MVVIASKLAIVKSISHESSFFVLKCACSNKMMKINSCSHHPVNKNSGDLQHFLKTIKSDSKFNGKVNKISKAICTHRLFLEDLLRQHSLDVSPDLIAHIFLLLHALTKSSSSMILASLKSHYNDDVIKSLLNMVDGRAIKMLQSKTSSCANDALCERLHEVCYSMINFCRHLGFSTFKISINFNSIQILRFKKY